MSARPATTPLLGPTRTRVARALRDGAEPLGAVQVATALGLHPNSARFHLEALVEEGLAERHEEERTSPGRPRVLYVASAHAAPDEASGYRELAEVLTEALTTPAATPAEAAEAAGAVRGAHLARSEGPGARPATPPARAPRGRGPGTLSAAGVVVEQMARLGFESRATRTADGSRVDITPCPFLDLVRTRGEVICAVHRGLVRGTLAELAPGVSLERLVPFADPHRCVVELRSAAG